MPKLNKEIFIEKSIKVHGNEYDYEKVIYINSKDKVIITCKKHGDFEQTPCNHYNNKQGCPICYGKKKLTNEEFIIKADKIHGNRFDYNKVEYKSCDAKIIITCKEHGDFEQTPRHHLKKFGCSKCSGKNKLTNEEFIIKAIKTHINEYSYNKVEYIGNKSKVIITCKEHGDFTQKPNAHLNGAGCPKCYGNIKYNNEELILKFINIHGDKYIYTEVNYINYEEKVKIICKKHGLFEQSPHSHISGKGCKSCKNSIGENKINIILNENNINFKPQYWFEDLKYINKLYFDFGILDENGNLKYLLEFNGQQHYDKFDLFHKTDEDFEKQKLKDKLKLDYCTKNNITLHIIKYNENINDKMKSIINI